MSDTVYKNVIDELARACKNGQGQIGPQRCRDGLWNVNATADFIEDQHEINVLLRDLSPGQREVLAGMLEQSFVGGAFEALRVLYDLQVPPFEDGFEGSPYNDFIGRLDDWQWPNHPRDL